MRSIYMHPVKPPARPRVVSLPRARALVHPASINSRRVLCYCAPPNNNAQVQTVDPPTQVSEESDDSAQTTALTSLEPYEDEPSNSSPPAPEPTAPAATAAASPSDAAPAEDATSEFATTFNSVATGQAQAPGAVTVEASVPTGPQPGSSNGTSPTAEASKPSSGTEQAPAAQAPRPAGPTLLFQFGSAATAEASPATTPTPTPSPADSTPATTAAAATTTTTAAATAATDATPTTTPAPPTAETSSATTATTTTTATDPSKTTETTETADSKEAPEPAAAAPSATTTTTTTANPPDSTPTKPTEGNSSNNPLAAASFLFSSFAAVANPGKATSEAAATDSTAAVQADSKADSKESEAAAGDKATVDAASAEKAAPEPAVVEAAASAGSSDTEKKVADAEKAEAEPVAVLAAEAATASEQQGGEKEGAEQEGASQDVSAKEGASQEEASEQKGAEEEAKEVAAEGAAQEGGLGVSAFEAVAGALPGVNAAAGDGGDAAAAAERKEAGAAGSGSNGASNIVSRSVRRAVKEVEPQRVLGDRQLGAVVAFTEVVTHEPFTLVRSIPMAGGTLEVTCWEGGRMLRVWLPPGFSRLEAGPTGYPTLYLNDGQNLFDPTLSLSGKAWDAAEAAAELIATGQVPPFVIVGIDNSGVSRSWDYLPYKPGTGPGNVRKDAANWPGGGIDEYFKRLLEEVLPWAQQEYNLATRADLMAFGGSSFGGINALYMGLKHPEVFGGLLVESPSLWFALEKCLIDDLPAHKGPWPARTFVAMGTAEYSGVRKDKEPEFDARLVSYVSKVVDIVKGYEGVEPGGVTGLVDEGATHTERCWAERLPGALKFLLGPWWGVLAGEVAQHLYFFAPRRLKAGGKAVMMVNKSRSRSLGGAAAVRLHLGFNNNWELAPAKVDLQPVEGAPGGQWLMGVFQIPEAAYEVHFVFSDHSQSVWDNNGGNNFYCRIQARPPSDLGSTPEEIIAAAKTAADAPADRQAQSNQGVLFFTTPDVAIAGAPLRVYLNRARSRMSRSPNCILHYGFNQWEDGGQKESLKPTNLWRAQHVDWWSTTVDVPATAKDFSFAFSDGGTLWESNNSHNYHITVRDPHRKRGQKRDVETCVSVEHAGGTMDVITLKKKPGLTRRARWTEERVMRIWTPPGFKPEDAPEGGWPVLVMNDAQNLFEDWLAHQGVSWRVGFTAAELIEAGDVPPFVVVAIDSAGPMRSLNYLPYPPGMGQGGFRKDAERWPGGGVDDYMRRVVEELLPLVTEKYNLATDPARVAFGGGSFGGVCSLYTAMHYPHVFGSVLVESPSLWIAEGQFLRDMAAFQGPLPERIFMAWGTREYSATRDHARPDVDQLLLSYYRQAHWILGTKGMRGHRMQTVEEQGAGHHESAWQWRLTGALRYLLGPWKGF